MVPGHQERFEGVVELPHPQNPKRGAVAAQPDVPDDPVLFCRLEGLERARDAIFRGLVPHTKIVDVKGFSANGRQKLQQVRLDLGPRVVLVGPRLVVRIADGHKGGRAASQLPSPQRGLACDVNRSIRRQGSRCQRVQIRMLPRMRQTQPNRREDPVRPSKHTQRHSKEYRPGRRIQFWPHLSHAKAPKRQSAKSHASFTSLRLCAFA